MPASIGKFGKGTKAPSPSAKGRKAEPSKAKKGERVARASKYADVDESLIEGNGPPILSRGRYRLRFVSATDESSPKKRSISWYKPVFEIVESEGADAMSVGEQGVLLFQSTDEYGQARIVAMIRHIAGCETPEDYREFDPGFLLPDACAGIENDMSEHAEAMVGRLVDCEITYGKKMEDKDDYFRNVEWAIVPDDEQE